MLLGVSHIELPVRSLDRARAFWCEAAAFAVVGEGAAHLDLEAHGGILRLVEGPPLPGIALHFQTAQVEEGLATLVAAGARLRRPAGEQDGRWLGEVETEEGYRLLLWRGLRESDRAEPIPLPTSRPWTCAAEEMALRLLAQVPESFRDLARRGMVAEAEHLAPDDEDVEILALVRAYIRSTPRLLRENLRPALGAEGFDLDAFPDDLQC